MVGTRRVCIWGGGGLGLTQVRDTLTQLGVPFSRVRRVGQRNGVRRYDCTMETDAVLEGVRRLARVRGWRVRPDCAPAQRRHRRVTTARRRVTGTGLKAVSWNIAGLEGKRLEVEYFLSLRGPDVVALQETNRRASSRRLRLHGYNCVESVVDGGVHGSRGVVLGVRKASGFTLEGLGEPTPFYCFGRIRGRLRRGPVFTTGDGRWTRAGPRTRAVSAIVGSVYVPSGTARKQVLEALGRHVARLRAKYPREPILVTGDWNVPRAFLLRWMARKGIPGKLSRIPGDPTTFSRRDGRHSAIDHAMLIGVPGSARTTVRREWDTSDHWPIETTCDMQWDGVQSVDRKTVLYRQKIAGVARRIAHANRWAPLLDLDGSDPSGLVQGFAEASQAVATGLGVLVKRAGREPRLNLSHDAKRAIDRRRELYRVSRRERTDAAAEAYWAAREEARTVVRDERKRLFAAWVSKACRSWRKHDMRAFWQWIRNDAEYKLRREAALGIVDPETGEVVTDPVRTAAIWAEHFGSLARDHTGHSRDPAHWSTELVDQSETLDGDSRPLQWHECAAVIKGMARGKASGLDGWPAEWYKACLVGRDADVTPVSPMARALWRLLRGVWDTETVPDAWNEASVVPVPKKGDLTRTDNYRGIALMQVGMKIISTVVARRLQRLAETHGLLTHAQAGFRSREEAVGQVAALYEIARRREIEGGRRTLVMFVDFAKAYDSVPHAALLRKLSAMGIRGKLLRLVTAMYRAPRLSVKTPSGSQSEAMPLEIGVRQGCPSSPILFNLFINDLVGELEAGGLGVDVPALDGPPVGALLFADDLVMLADSPGQLGTMVGRLEGWCRRWEMRVNVSKCGVMQIGDGTTDDLDILVGGDRVPVVEAYTYLGCRFTRDLDLDEMARHRAKIGMATLEELRPFIANSTIPVWVRRHAVTSIVLPRMLYGAEVWGMHGGRCTPAQRVANRGMRLLLSIGGMGPGLSLNAMREELGIGTVEAMAAARRARAIVKFCTLRTWIARLIRCPLTAHKATWVSGTTRWLTKYTAVPPVQDAREQDPSGQSMQRRVYRTLMDREAQRDDTAAMRWRRKLRLQGAEEAGVTGLMMKHPHLARGLGQLMKLRCRAIRFAPWLVQAERILPEFRATCPMCMAGVPEDEAHMLLSCPALAASKKILFIDVS